jgi:transposase-like protein
MKPTTCLMVTLFVILWIVACLRAERPKRDVAAAKGFFTKAMKKHGTPRVITLDAYAASRRAIMELQSVGTLARRVVMWSSKYLNDVAEQDHRHIEQRVRAMLVFRRFETVAITISGIELVEKIRKRTNRYSKPEAELIVFGVTPGKLPLDAETLLVT